MIGVIFGSKSSFNPCQYCNAGDNVIKNVISPVCSAERRNLQPDDAEVPSNLAETSPVIPPLFQMGASATILELRRSI